MRERDWGRLAVGERRDLERALEALEESRRIFPLAHLRPHERQLAFTQSTKRIRVFLGGNRSGKTYIGAAEAIAHALGYRPWEIDDVGPFGSDYPAREEVPESAWVRYPDGRPIPVPNVGMVVSGQGWERGVGMTVHPLILRFLGGMRSRTRRGQMGVVRLMEFPSGSRIHFGAATQHRMSFEGVSCDWAWVDEPVPRWLFVSLWRALAESRGRLSFTLTPLGADAAWIYSSIVSGDTPADVYTVAMADNPYLEREALEEFERQTVWTEEERLARLYGRFEHLGGLVHPEFRRRDVVVDMAHLDPAWPRIHAVDPHLSRPHYMLWAAVDPEGTKWVYREWPRATAAGTEPRVDYGARDYAGIIMEEERGERITVRVLDPFAISGRWGREDESDELLRSFARYGLIFSRAPAKKLAAGVERVRTAITPRDGRTELKIFSHCRGLIASLEQLSYLPEREVSPARISKKGKDPWDALRYCLFTADQLNFRGRVASYLTARQLQELTNG